MVLQLLFDFVESPGNFLAFRILLEVPDFPLLELQFLLGFFQFFFDFFNID